MMDIEKIDTRTVESCIVHAKKFLAAENSEMAAVFIQVAQVRAYGDRTRMLGEVTGWGVQGTYDQYAEHLRGGLTDMGISISDSIDRFSDSIDRLTEQHNTK